MIVPVTATLKDDELGAIPVDGGVRFRLYSAMAEQVELCLFGDDGRESRRHFMVQQSDGIWEWVEPHCGVGSAYGYRVHGPWNPDLGQRYNPAKLLLDPYARLLRGEFHWTASVFDYQVESAGDFAKGQWVRDERDSAPFVPRSVVTTAAEHPPPDHHPGDWASSIVYEANVRGFTMRHPQLNESERGRFAGLSNGAVLDYLKALGITTVELQPVQEFIDEQFLADRGLRNYWGYNTLAFMAPAQRYAGHDPVGEFKAMVTAIHDAGLDVLLDVAFNHTAEGGSLGPTLSFRGLDNLVYYRAEQADPGVYINDTGCGNTINADHPRVQALILDSLSHWHREMGVDGFRFDLAPVLGRHDDGFNPDHPLLHAITHDPRLANAQMVAEPWDPGPGGYQLGKFPTGWAEWNDQYRDTLRGFWRGDKPHLGNLAEALSGSPAVFAGQHRGRGGSVNFITAHDGFTLDDLVSYLHKHNEANGEDNRDGHGHNLSANHGIEGVTDHAVVQALRKRHRLNLMANLLLSQGVPMLLAGDELGHSQGGNNNAYAQDNEITWLDWTAVETDSEFLQQVRQLIALRKTLALNDSFDVDGHWKEVQWLRPDGHMFSGDDWQRRQHIMQVYVSHGVTVQGQHTSNRIIIVINGEDHEVCFQLPELSGELQWTLRFASDRGVGEHCSNHYKAAAWSIACLTED